MMQTIQRNMVHLKLLSEKYPTKEQVKMKMTTLLSILDLPKGTEHFLSDIHGEAQTFEHILRNASGSIRRKIEETFLGELSEADQRELATIIYYPLPKLASIKQHSQLDVSWYTQLIKRLVRMVIVCSKKYTKRKRDTFLDEAYVTAVNELIRLHTEQAADAFFTFCASLYACGLCDAFIDSLCSSIRRMNIDHLHILGDIYDRGTSPHRVMDLLERFARFDIQWGNHDIVWLGAASGSAVCCANVVRIALRYANIDVLEKGYGINLLPLMSLAGEEYAQDTDLEPFMPRFSGENVDLSKQTIARMHKAITIIQFKLESALYRRNPGYQMQERDLMGRTDFVSGEVEVDGVRCALRVAHFPTVDPADPCRLTEREQLVVDALLSSFAASERLQRHASLMVEKGGMYKVYNGNLLFHGCIPMTQEGEFKRVCWDGKHGFSGKGLMDAFERTIKKLYLDQSQSKDFFWYAWAGADSPLFGKDKMATFERYFLSEKHTHKEQYCPYFAFRERRDIAERVLAEFGLESEQAKIINGHVPVNFSGEENYIKAEGKVILIDGGFSSAYRKITGSAGVTLKSNSYGMSLIVHSPFYSIVDAIESETDIDSEKRFLPKSETIIRIRDTDVGKEIEEEIGYLKLLLQAYELGEIPCKETRALY